MFSEEQRKKLIAEEQLKKIVEDLTGLLNSLKRIKDIKSFLQFNWRLHDDLDWKIRSTGKPALPSEIEDFLLQEQKDHFKYLRRHLDDVANSASYLQSFLDSEGNFLITPNIPEDGDEDEDYDGDDWHGTSSAGTRLAKELNQLYQAQSQSPSQNTFSPEDAVDILRRVLLCEDTHAISYIRRAFAGFPEKELHDRLCAHVYGTKEEQEARFLARLDPEARQRLENYKKSKNDQTKP